MGLTAVEEEVAAVKVATAMVTATGDGDGDGLGAGLGDEGDGAGAGSSPPHATRAAPQATESESVKKSALRFTGRRHPERVEAV